MKTIAYIFIALVLISCGEQTTQVAQVEKETNIPNENDSLAAIKVVSPVNKKLHITGYVKVPPKSKLDVYSKTNGFIQDILVSPGQYVKKGQLLFTISSPEFPTLQMDYLSAKAELELYQKDLIRIQELYDAKSVSKKELEQATFNFKNSNARFNGNKALLETLGFSISAIDNGQIQHYLVINSQIEGYLTSLNANLGQSVGANQLLATVVNTQQMYLELLVPNTQINQLAIGDSLTFSIQKNNGNTENNTAIISTITNQIDMATGTVKVMAIFNLPNKLNLKEGQVVFVEI
jgi:membrane fusion protein, heavy metal efflux system